MTKPSPESLKLYLSQFLDVDPDVLVSYGAFDVSVASDLPLFIDPFLLFHSIKPDYQALHESILRYLRFLRDKAADGDLDEGMISNLYRFREVKQNWLGFSVLGNGGHGLGHNFAVALHSTLGNVLSTFGSEIITRSSHLEKVSLLRPGVGRDSISDFTTNLIKEYLLEYTQTFAKQHVDPDRCRTFRVRRARFNYVTEAWEDDSYYLPIVYDDYVLLTPIDMLTRDETWINHTDMIQNFRRVPEAIPDAQLRAQVNNYFAKHLGQNPSTRDRREAASRTIRQFPELLDYYIRLKEDTGERAEAVSLERVDDLSEVFINGVKCVVGDLDAKTDFYQIGLSSYDEALRRVHAFKHYVEHQDGYRLINRNGKAFAKEPEVQLFFGLIWFGSLFDVNREPNNGRGPVDFKVSIGAADKSLIEFKLASNSQLKRNLENQIKIYEKANNTKRSIKVIICYTKADQTKVAKILKVLAMTGREDVVTIDARSDNKPSASKA